MAKGVSRLFKGLGDDALRGIKNLWHGGPDMAKILKTDAIEEIPNAIHKAKLYKTTLSDEITLAMESAKKTVHDELKDVSSKMIKARNELRMANKTLASREAELARARVKSESIGMNQEAWTRSVESLEDNIVTQRSLVQNYESALEEASLSMQELSSIYKGIRQNPRATVHTILSNPTAEAKFPSLSRWIDSVNTHLSTKQRIMQATSRYKRDSSFLKEYINEIYPQLRNRAMDGKETYAKLWMSNPSNASRLAGLKSGRKYMKVLQELELDPAIIKQLSVANRANMLKKLKTVGALGIGGGAVAFLTMFDNNSEKAVAQADKVEQGSERFKVFGKGRAIFVKALTASRNAEKAILDAETSLGSNPEQASAKLMIDLSQQKAILDDCIQNWDIVMANSDNPKAAKRSLDGLVELSNTLGAMLGEASGIVGKPQSGGVAGNIPKKRTISLEHIKSIQNYLKTRFPTVAPTGTLDRPTIRALRLIERELDESGDTGGRISDKRLLVRPNEGHLMELNDLKKIENMIKR